MSEASSALLSVNSLSVAFGATPVVKDLSFSVEAGRTLAIVGESGSGKSVTSLTIMRLIDHLNGRILKGNVLYRGRSEEVDLAKASSDLMRSIRGKDIAMIFQEPMTSLNPVFTIGDQIGEALILHEKLAPNAARKRAEELLRMVRLPDASALLDRNPHQLSGGMRQRVMIAMALACKPKLLIADEPTTALDVTIQAQILTIIRDLQQELGMGVIFITHDMGVVAEMADDVVVMWRGSQVESGPVEQIFNAPQHPYTQALLAAVPKLGSMKGESHPKRSPVMVVENDSVQVVGDTHIQDTARYTESPLLSVKNMVTRFDVRHTLFGKPTHRVHAVENVSFDIYPGETLALVGESGSGKTCIGRTVQQLLQPTSGEILFKGVPIGKMGRSERKKLKQEVQFIFQDPFASLDPRRTIGFSIAEPIRTHQLLTNNAAIEGRVHQLLERVGLSPSHANRYPHQFSGGQRQRICIARALASNPKLIIADEALSALDVSIQAQIINLLMELQEQEGLSYLFISHDMAVVEQMSHRVAVLYLGQIVEMGQRRDIFENPQHAYTRRLLSAVPVPIPGSGRNRPLLEGEIPSRVCPADIEPELWPLEEISQGHFVAANAGLSL